MHTEGVTNPVAVQMESENGSGKVTFCNYVMYSRKSLIWTPSSENIDQMSAIMYTFRVKYVVSIESLI